MSSKKGNSNNKIAKKRKRESIKQTKFKARLRMKLIENKWEVTHFVRDHNHDFLLGRHPVATLESSE